MRLRITLSLLVAVLVVTLVAGPAAHASTVSVANKTFTAHDGDTQLRSVLTYKAAAGEQNDLTFRSLTANSSDEAPFEVSDPGAVIQPGSGCTRVGANTHLVRCTASALSCPECDVDLWTQGLRVSLRDGADRLRATEANANENVLDGGPGPDEIHGTGSDDTIVEGDTSGGPAGDNIDGGGGVDAVSYAGRRGGVRVDLGAGTGGAGGKEDVIARVSDVIGSRGNDVLTGDGRRNILSGGRGKDRINGKAGNDRIDGGASADKLRGGDGRDRIVGGSGRDSLSGGTGRDALLSRDRSRDRVDGGSGRDSCRADRRDRVRRVERLRRSRR